jgi:hypothetical protein
MALPRFDGGPFALSEFQPENEGRSLPSVTFAIYPM